MYTQCPSCKTLFNVTAEQLRSARGQVQCGQCTKTFDALAYLTDGHIPKIEQHGDRTIVRTPAIVRQETIPEPVVESSVFAETVAEGFADKDSAFNAALAELASNIIEVKSNQPEVSAHDGAVNVYAESVPAITAHVEAPGAEQDNLRSAHSISQDVADDARTDTTDDPARGPGEYQWHGETNEIDDASDIPQVLEEDIAMLVRQRREKKFRWFFSALAFLLLLTLGAQYAWFMPNDMAKRYPQTRPWLNELCSISGCDLVQSRDPSKVKIVSRDVRVHPKYEGALLITAVLVNEAEFVQAYPKMRFTVFNVNGQTIAARDFAPRDYLAGDVEVDEGMRPKSPTQISLDIVAPEEAAVSFEFKFL